MAFTALTNLTQEQYQALSASFSRSPDTSKTGTPDPRISAIFMKGWVSDTVVAFSVTTAAQAMSAVNISTTVTNGIDVSLYGSASTQPVTTYWTVDVGTDDGKSKEWSVNFNVVASSRSTGTWVFRKGTTVDPDL